jgi:16S rRNA processing protein RimM
VNSKDLVYIGKLGRSVGLKGALKIYFDTDFSDQFCNGHTFQSKKGQLIIKNINNDATQVVISGYESLELAKKLTNTELYMSKENTNKYCTLEKEEYFWYDIIGMKIIENKQLLGIVENINRLSGVDYLLIKTDNILTTHNSYAKSFMIPYIERYIIKVEEDKKEIIVKDSLDILSAS